VFVCLCQEKAVSWDDMNASSTPPVNQRLARLAWTRFGML